MDTAPKKKSRLGPSEQHEIPDVTEDAGDSAQAEDGTSLVILEDREGFNIVGLMFLFQEAFL